MKIRRLITALLVAVTCSSAAGLAAAAELADQTQASVTQTQNMDEAPMHQSMGDPGRMMGMMHMMGMMDACHDMMNSASADSITMPRLPPGNAKLEFQMRAEMLQKMGEIAAKYANKIKEEK